MEWLEKHKIKINADEMDAITFSEKPNLDEKQMLYTLEFCWTQDWGWENTSRKPGNAKIISDNYTQKQEVTAT